MMEVSLGTKLKCHQVFKQYNKECVYTCSKTSYIDVIELLVKHRYNVPTLLAIDHAS